MLRTTNRYEGYAPVPDALAGQCVTLKHLRWPLPAESPENSTAGKRAGGLAGCSCPCKADTLQNMMQSIAAETMKSLGGRQGQ